MNVKLIVDRDGSIMVVGEDGSLLVDIPNNVFKFNERWDDINWDDDGKKECDEVKVWLLKNKYEVNKVEWDENY